MNYNIDNGPLTVFITVWLLVLFAVTSILHIFSWMVVSFLGERKSPYVAICCIAMAASILFWQWDELIYMSSNATQEGK